ncbi:FG-GAP-like repeat-containing protein, partial [Bacteroidota bacterium]
YTLIVTDSLGCYVTADVKINEPICNITLTTTKTSVSQIGASDGQANVTPINGTAPYSFLWNDPAAQTNPNAIGLAMGQYQVIVTDSIGCKDTAEVVILELPCIDESRFYSSLGASDVEICYINNDSILDIVTLYSVAYSTDRVNVLLGNGDGTFTYHSSFIVGTGGDQPMNIEVNDFNGDSINDIVVTVPDGVNGISVYLGNGDATFQTNVNYFIGSRPWDMVSYDFDYDGDIDLLICREQGNDVRMVKNNGNAVFSASGSKSVGSNPKDIKAGYLNNDTIIDLVVVNKNQANMSVLLGTSSYYFSSSVSYLVGLNPFEAALGDFNNDSITDIAIVCSSPYKLYIFIGNGDGTFQTRVEYPAGNSPQGISAIDINNDSNIDLVVLNSSGNNLLVILGEGNGVFDSIMMYPMTATPLTSAVADLDKDGDDDLIVAMSAKDSIAILHNCFFDNCLYLLIDSIKSANIDSSNGFAGITVIGKNPPFSYQWNDSLQQTTATADSIAAGTYKVVVTDSIGCKDSILVVIDEIPCVIDTNNFSISLCQGDSVLFAGIFLKSTGQYRDTAINVFGCDSISILNLYVNINSANSILIESCYSYTAPSGTQTFTLSGIYNDTIQNAAGCDSIITINLTVNHSSSASITQTVCDSYIVPSGHETYTLSGVYHDTISNYKNCDSLLTINLTVNHSSIASITNTVCNSYIVPSGHETYTLSGVYHDTIPNYQNCDSLITINLTVNHSSVASITDTVCNSYIVPSGHETYTLSGVYHDTIPNYQNCDSLITINLTVNHSSVASMTDTVCNSYIVPSGHETYTLSGVYQDTIPNYKNCDSLITINLTVNNSSVA